MLLILSPAKSLNFAPPEAGLPMTEPDFRAEIGEVLRSARRLSRTDLRRLMNISPALAELNHARFQAFDPDAETGLQAAVAFDGDVYAGLDARTLDRAALAWAQDRIRILSGLYGVLRPLDAIQPYRLEMGARLKTRRGPDLYAFWGEKIARALDAACAGHADPTVVNLASDEYFGAVRTQALPRRVVKCRFLESRLDEPPRVYSFYAKRARGLMARYAIERRLERAEDLQAFDIGGYRFDPAQSKADDWSFVRPHPNA